LIAVIDHFEVYLMILLPRSVRLAIHHGYSNIAQD